MRRTAIPGHGLIGEGMAWASGGDDGAPYWHVPYADRFLGVGRCQCGAASPVLRSNAARRRWHNDHKAALGRGTS